MDPADRLLALAEQRIAHGQSDGAIDALRQLLGEVPDHAAAHALLAAVLIDKKRLHAARHEAGLALAADPELEFAHFVSGRVALARRQFDEAEERFEHLRSLNPTKPAYHRELATLHTLRGADAKALPLLEQALALDPEDPATLADLASYWEARRDFDRAEGYARAALNVDPEHLDAIVVMGQVHLGRGDLDTARAHAAWALGNDPSHTPALHLLAMIKARRSPVIGIWWRYNAWMSGLGSTRAILVLLGAFLVYRLADITVGAMGHPDAARVIEWVWLGIVAYTFFGPVLFQRALQKELAQVRLSREF
ncbi:MAG TPA: tetratricopeptide repeat protein [Nevskiaceae bacterium]|nr:tetratricopeptide repeat protein [Nevskiaceae bacterium]